MNRHIILFFRRSSACIGGSVLFLFKFNRQYLQKPCTTRLMTAFGAPKLTNKQTWSPVALR